MFAVCKLPSSVASGLLIGRSCLAAGHDGPGILRKQLYCPLQLYFGEDLRRLASAPSATRTAASYMPFSM
jgi:hypothetical protein